MKIKAALKKANKSGKLVRNISLAMEGQDEATLFYWVALDRDSNLGVKIKRLVDILYSDEWEVDVYHNKGDFK